MGLLAIITKVFLGDVKRQGEIALALKRLQIGDAPYEPLPLLSTWELVCEEVVDTTHEPEYYERVAAELLRRGLTDDEINQMRVFAWQTAGWLNYGMMLWEWVSLDENDILLAIRLMLKEGLVSARESAQMNSYVQRYATKKERQ